MRWSLDFDLMSSRTRSAGRSRPVGFYYRTFIRPRALWPLYEKFLRGAAGLGKLDPHAGHSRRYDTEHRRARVLVVGGGCGGARRGARGGEGRPRRRPRRRGRPHRATRARGRRGARARPGARDLGGRPRPGRRRHGPLPLPRREDRRRDGATEQPLVFPGNDLVGVMLPDGVRRLVRDFSIKPGERAVVLGADDETLAIATSSRRSAPRS